MDFKRRKEVIDILNYLEENFRVENWRIEGLHVWPILKMILFFGEADKPTTGVEKIKQASGYEKIGRIGKNVRRIFESAVSIVRMKLRKRDFLFSGAFSHRVLYDGKYINRFFDPMAGYLRHQNRSAIIMDYHSQRPFSDSYVRLDVIAPMFKTPFRLGDDSSTAGEFSELMDEIALQFGISKVALVQLLRTVIKSTLQWKRLFLWVFKRVKPQYCFGLCYYSAEMWGMNAAARELGIISVDMQHGTQGQLHAGYSFSRLPERGYNVLPDEFWCWDEGSYQHIQSWAKDSRHKARLSGNPWNKFLSDKGRPQEGVFPKDKPMILYTHQPLKPLFNDYMLEVIKETQNEYSWWIRLHPRTTEQEKREIIKLLDHHGIRKAVEMEKAAGIPLPVLFSASSLHISKFSGSIIEAAAVGKFSVILEEIGISTFKDIINEGKAVGVTAPNVESLIETIADALDVKMHVNPEHSFEQLLDGIISSAKSVSRH